MLQQEILEAVKLRNPNEPEFLQAAEEVIHSVVPAIERNASLAQLKILERMLEPERSVSFRVTWTDDKGESMLTAVTGYR
jgi:glutamate dehydrogenase (NADP+)